MTPEDAARNFAESVRLHVAQSWALERDRFESELSDVRTRLNTLADYMNGAEQTLDSADDDLRNEFVALNRRMEKLTHAVAGLMAGGPVEGELHSVKVPPTYWYPALCTECGHTFDSDSTDRRCPECDAGVSAVAFGPLNVREGRLS